MLKDNRLEKNLHKLTKNQIKAICLKASHKDLYGNYLKGEHPNFQADLMGKG